MSKKIVTLYGIEYGPPSKEPKMRKNHAPWGQVWHYLNCQKKKKKILNRLRLDMRGKQGIAEEAGRESRHGVGLGTSCAC